MKLTANRIGTTVVSRFVIGCFTSVLALGLLQVIALAQAPDQEYVEVVVEGLREPNPGTPEVGVSDERKRTVGSIEAEDFRKMTIVGSWVRKDFLYGGQGYSIYEDTRDPELAIKVAAVHNAVKIVIDRGLRIPRNLTVYCLKYEKFPQNCGDCMPALNIAFKRGPNFAPVAKIILTNIQPLQKVTISSSGFRGLDKPTITVIHEIGHIWHERSAGEFYWTKACLGAPKRGAASNVSTYASDNKKEFVAEVFAASVIGMRIRNLDWFEYSLYRGPFAVILSR